MKKGKFKRFRTMSSLVILGVLGFAAVAVTLLGRLHTTVRRESGAPEYAAFYAFVGENARENIRKVSLTDFREYRGYGRATCRNYSEYVEYALLCDDLTDYMTRSLARRRWAYQNEKAQFDTLVVKPVKTKEDSITINKTVMRMQAYARMIDAEQVPEELQRELLENRVEAHRILDSIDRKKGFQLTYDVVFKDKTRSRMTFISPSDSLSLTLTEITAP